MLAALELCSWIGRDSCARICGSTPNGNAWTNYTCPGCSSPLQFGIAVVTAMIFGLIRFWLALFAIIRGASGLVVEFFRAVPVLVMMFFLYFFPVARGPHGTVRPDSRRGDHRADGLATVRELIRLVRRSLPKGQREAAAAIGMTNNQRCGSSRSRRRSPRCCPRCSASSW